MITNVTDFINIYAISCLSNALRLVECIILGLTSGKSRFV